MSIQALRERLNARAQEVRKLLDENPGEKWKAEHQTQYDAAMTEIETIKAEIKRNQEALDALADDAIDNSLDRIHHDATKKGDVKKALHAKWLRHGDNALSAADWQQIRNTMSTTTGSEGGYTVATEVARTVVESLKAFGGMRAVANVLVTESGNPMNFPTTDGTSETGEIVAENAGASDADASFGTKAVNVFKYSSKVITVPIELLQDSAIDIEGLVNRRLVQRLGRITNTHFTVGTGSGQPTGAVPAAGAGKVGASGQTTTIIVDDLIDLSHAVDPAYRGLSHCRFMMHDSSLKIIRKLKDSTGRPIFMPGYDGLGGPMPDTILGYEVVINQDMPVMAASAKSVLFGDFSFYTIRDALQLQLFRFTDSAYSKYGQVGFLGFLRSGGNLLDTGALKYYQNAAS